MAPHSSTPEHILSSETANPSPLFDDTQVCCRLKTKGLYLDGLEDPDMYASGSSTPYWCLVSMNAFGPDGNFVCPEECKPQRACFSCGGK